jgi:hypothetical protein
MDRLDFREDEVHVERQYSASTRRFELPKNGRKRAVVLTPPAKAGLLDMPRPVMADELVFRGSKGGPLTGRTSTTTGTRSGVGSDDLRWVSTGYGTLWRGCSTS